MTDLFTIGYEGKKLDELILILKNNSVKCLVDVRELPLSRKKGFSKTPLAEACRISGIKYVHMRAAGNPREIRKKYAKKGEYQKCLDRYHEYLKLNSHVVSNLYKYIIAETSCLLCFEKDPSRCHRSILTTELKAFNGTKIAAINL
jgi:uncharacterized protein (DUF488 family)